MTSNNDISLFYTERLIELVEHFQNNIYIDSENLDYIGLEYILNIDRIASRVLPQLRYTYIEDEQTIPNIDYEPLDMYNQTNLVPEILNSNDYVSDNLDNEELLINVNDVLVPFRGRNYVSLYDMLTFLMKVLRYFDSMNDTISQKRTHLNTMLSNERSYTLYTQIMRIRRIPSFDNITRFKNAIFTEYDRLRLSFGLDHPSIFNVEIINVFTIAGDV